jgi:hypothetical protein
MELMLGRRKVWLAAVAGAAAAVGSFGGAVARAGMIAPGGSVSVSATTFAAGSDLAGTVLRDELIPFTVRGARGQSIFEGTLQDRVIRLDGGGTLVFAQTVRADRGFDRPVILDFLRRTGFAGHAADADFTASGGDASPEKVFRSADGDLLHFKFDDKLFPGEATRLSFVRTESTAFDLGGDTQIAFIAKGGVEGEVHLRTAQPSAGGGNPVAIPFPPAAAVFPLGAAAALWARRRFRRG